MHVLGHAGAVTLGGNRVLQNPTNLAQGSYLLKVIQDGTGSRTLSTFTDYCWPGGVAPTLTTGANAIDILTFWSDGSKLYGGVQYNFRVMFISPTNMTTGMSVTNNGTGAYGFMLDQFPGADVALSLRRLSTAYNGPI